MLPIKNVKNIFYKTIQFNDNDFFDFSDINNVSMICLENIVEFVPFGRKVSDNHPARPDENRAAGQQVLPSSVKGCMF